MQKRELEDILGKEIFQMWGQKEARTFEDLEAEIAGGETRLAKRGEKVIRQVDLVELEVIHPSEPEKRLYEMEQLLFSTQEKRTRNRFPGEKIKAGESPEQALKRGLIEETSLSPEQYEYKLIRHYQKEGESVSYPGLTTEYTIYHFQVLLNPEAKVPLEHRTESGDILYFTWK